MARKKGKSSAVFVGLLGILLTGCADRAVYEWSLKHAYITPWTHLSPSDHEEIVRLISSANSEPIVGITSHRPSKDGSIVTVFTNGNTDRNDDKFWTGYELKKKDGKWRITFHGEASPMIAHLAMSKQGHEMEERR